MKRLKAITSHAKRDPRASPLGREPVSNIFDKRVQGRAIFGIELKLGLRSSAFSDDKRKMTQVKSMQFTQSLADDVYDALRMLIVKLELPPGSILNETTLCERFSVSRTPLREAILRLSRNGLVTVAPRHATFVAPIDARRVRQAHFLRSNLELPMVRKLCEHDKIDLGLSRELVTEQQKALQTGDYSQFLPLDDRLHESLFDQAGLDEIWRVIHAKKAQLDRIRFLQGPQPGKPKRLIEQHTAILDAIERRDAEAAEAVLKAHIAGAVLYMEELLILKPELFGTKAQIARRRNG
ncbi:GntR family transcriptional regulator [Fulvimarina sp. 2208YS6-2-32]|uniref:GntR family transcriptional regulator n=1 Tax=Fulvimarina uroteuthidis TaxID=3098149 RepID=A0ABU5HYD3_9HYPH|nr:GntR family transcriptional regulator [Fulvimarina sp. 2208YS6-2-32]MDY8108139.1 GntR family transcriptional regulator [Fulvimarina sp. 2208YS6-2-32]